MPLLLFLNERSCTSNASPPEVAKAMDGLIRVLREARTWREIALVTRTPLARSELARGYYYQQWAADNRHRNQRQYIKALRNRAPFAEVLPRDPVPGDVEHEYAGERVEGIGAAHLLDGLAVSLPVSTAWHRSWLEVTVRTLVESDEGHVVMREATEPVRHGSRPVDLKAHERWGRSSGLHAIGSPTQLWAERADFFPSLRFLPRARQDLESLQPPAFVQVRGLLARLEESVARWDPSAAAVPAWQGAKVTPEHEQRKRLCSFTDEEGEKHCYDWHGRFTPGAGRLHFRLLPGERALEIAYIGPKIEP
ncbi:hypothetical protein [Streptomyces sp. SBT349]|uniref:hypothetical protein n=1 Tax=Streptomyces sp. SBT349 TaxID=1580539 RepID=UPI000B0D6058|nr:hypothetical protein [Streptomyces sp. SBT349]